MQHVVPVNDLRDHVTNGDPCPCLPRQLPGVVMHFSYDARETGEVCRRALDLLATALTSRGHTWAATEREAYEYAIRVLDMHWPR